ncbi:MAG: hypothetical protein GEV10_22830 [Streptosporangiales bacterium]|nr:hypothetical protein [Streptosporangiales bacterium]
MNVPPPGDGRAGWPPPAPPSASGPPFAPGPPFGPVRAAPRRASGATTVVAAILAVLVVLVTVFLYVRNGIWNEMSAVTWALVTSDVLSCALLLTGAGTAIARKVAGAVLMAVGGAVPLLAYLAYYGWLLLILDSVPPLDLGTAVNAVGLVGAAAVVVLSVLPSTFRYLRGSGPRST